MLSLVTFAGGVLLRGASAEAGRLLIGNSPPSMGLTSRTLCFFCIGVANDAKEWTKRLRSSRACPVYKLCALMLGSLKRRLSDMFQRSRGRVDEPGACRLLPKLHARSF